MVYHSGEMLTLENGELMRYSAHSVQPVPHANLRPIHDFLPNVPFRNREDTAMADHFSKSDNFKAVFFCSAPHPPLIFHVHYSPPLFQNLPLFPWLLRPFCPPISSHSASLPTCLCSVATFPLQSPLQMLSLSVFSFQMRPSAVSRHGLCFRTFPSFRCHNLHPPGCTVFQPQPELLCVAASDQQPDRASVAGRRPAPGTISGRREK